MDIASQTLPQKTPINGAMKSRPTMEVPVGHRFLIFEAESDTRASVGECLGDENDVVFCPSAAEIATLLMQAKESSCRFDLLIWGLSIPCEDEIEALHRLRELNPEMKIVLLAPQEALAFAPAIKLVHADAFVLKPLHASDLKSAIERALQNSSASVLGPRTRPILAPVPSDSVDPGKFDDGVGLGLIGASPEMRRIFSLIRRVGPASVNVMITGESGTGKEVVANAIHRVSDRARKPFVAINCAAIPRDLLESELFGHARGAFTGAVHSRRGLFEEAHEGTILLDEIGDLPLPLQAKILRLIQTREVKPLGQNTSREVDVRIISATHKNLKSLIQKGEFREDLYYRLNVMPIHLPPLRERKDDVLLLAEHFLKTYSERRRTKAPVLNRRAEAKLLNLPWRGNVRELENLVERAIVLCDGAMITESDILGEESEVARVSSEDLFNAGLTLKDIEREYIRYVLSRVGNRKETATRILGIDRKTLYRKERLYGFRSGGDST